MPIYEYECASCRMRFERWQKMHDEPVKNCPDCGGTTRRLLHPVGIIFKGSGFYVTDNRKSSTSSSAPKSDGGGGTGGTGDTAEKTTSSEPAPAKKDAGEKAEAKVGGK